jgi:preprotein translocase subunit SecE
VSIRDLVVVAMMVAALVLIALLINALFPQ